jgi:hypothetical protein
VLNRRLRCLRRAGLGFVRPPCGPVGRRVELGHNPVFRDVRRSLVFAKVLAADISRRGSIHLTILNVPSRCPQFCPLGRQLGSPFSPNLRIGGQPTAIPNRRVIWLLRSGSDSAMHSGSRLMGRVQCRYHRASCATPSCVTLDLDPLSNSLSLRCRSSKE